MPNSFSYLALFSWPVVVFVLFRIFPRAEALAWSIIGGYLLLPFGVGINPPLVPTIDKNLVPSFFAGVMCLMVGERPVLPFRRGAAPASPLISAQISAPRAVERASHNALRDAGQHALTVQAASALTVQPAFTRQQIRRPARTSAVPISAPDQAESQMQRIPLVITLLLVLMLLSRLLTYQENTDVYRVASRVMPALSLYDLSSLALGAPVMLLPFLLGLRYLGAPQAQISLLRVFCLAGLLYSLPILLEVRLSPQLSRWVYGFLAQKFSMAMRGDGFRPIVFLQAGLWLAIYVAMTALAAFALWRVEKAAGRKGWALLGGLWLTGVMFLSHSLGALAILVALAPFCLLIPARSQIFMAALISSAILIYPVLRGAGIAPVGLVYDMAASISTERALSFQFRIKNEDTLLAHANQRPLAGWGGYGRSRVYDPQTGEDISVTDGAWIIFLGTSGWAGYIAVFGLLAAPPIILIRRFKRLMPGLATSGLCLVLAANMIDLIPNATLTPITWLIAGALAGRARYDLAAASDPQGAAESPLAQRPAERDQNPRRRSGPATRR